MRRGKIIGDHSEKIRALEREIDGVRRQLGAEILRADQAEADRAAVLRAAAGAMPDADLPFVSPMGRRQAAEWLRRMADETPAAEALPDEDPARIDRVRPEFSEHASVESIDAQLRRARAQQRRWHLRAEWLISLRATRVAQQERGEWPAAGAQQDGARPSV